MKINIDTTKLKADCAETIADTLVNVDEIWDVIERFVIEVLQREVGVFSFTKGYPSLLVEAGRNCARIKIEIYDDSEDLDADEARERLPIVEEFLAELTVLRDGLRSAAEAEA